MNLRSIVNTVTSKINPNESVEVLRSAGYIAGPGARQVPTYHPPVSGPAQIQALDSSDLKQIANLNIQGSIRAIYLRGTLAGVLRPDSKGGDIIKRNCGAEEWLVTKVLESWPTWTKAVIVLQEVEA